ncbi:MAG TPA: hypothetical protein VKE40_15085 [Gemmataceae bacterium]|nr:hypothetical protein [Gemmataceae bacterium]
MRHWFVSLAVVFAAAGVAAADEKAEAIVKKGIEAHGGADNLNKYKAAKFTMKGDLSVLGMNLDFTGDIAYSLPDRFRLNMTMDVMGMKMVIHQVVKGDKVKNSVKVGDTVVPADSDKEKEELKAAAAFQEAEQLTPLLDPKKFEIKAADDEDVDGKKAAVIVAKAKAVDKEMKICFDKTTGLIVKTAHKGLGPGEGGQPAEVYEESYPSEYKKVNGLQMPTKVVINHDGKKFMTMTASDIEILEKLDDKEFTVDD